MKTNIGEAFKQIPCTCGEAIECTGVSSKDDDNEEFIVDWICSSCKQKYIEQFKQTEPNFYKIKFYKLKRGNEG